jgi:hypothetical protein
VRPKLSVVATRSHLRPGFGVARWLVFSDEL